MKILHFTLLPDLLISAGASETSPYTRFNTKAVDSEVRDFVCAVHFKRFTVKQKRLVVGMMKDGLYNAL